MIIAIDGPAASGKGTLGKRLAHHYGYRHLDTGVIYRAVAYALMSTGADLHDETAAVAAALELDPEKFGNPILKTQKVGEAASVVSAIPRVREKAVNHAGPVIDLMPALNAVLHRKCLSLTRRPPKQGAARRPPIGASAHYFCP